MAGQQPGRLGNFGRQFRCLGPQEFIVLQVAVAGGAIDSMQLQFLRKCLPRQHPLQLGRTHLLHVLESHVFADAQNDLRDVVIRETQPAQNLLRDLSPDPVMFVESNPVRRALKGWRLAHVVKQHGERQQDSWIIGCRSGLPAATRLSGIRHQFHHQLGVRKHVTFGMKLRWLLDALHRFHLGQHLVEQPNFIQQRQAPSGVWTRENLDQLIADAFGTHDANLCRHVLCRPKCCRIDLVAEIGRKPDTPQHPQLVLLESLVGIADRADDLSLDVRLSANEIDDLASDGIKEQPIDCEIAPLRVSLG